MVAVRRGPREPFRGGGTHEQDGRPEIVAARPRRGTRRRAPIRFQNLAIWRGRSLGPVLASAMAAQRPRRPGQLDVVDCGQPADALDRGAIRSPHGGHQVDVRPAAIHCGATRGGVRCNARPSRADLDPSCVLEPEALGARNLPWPAPRPSAPLEPPPPHRNGLRHPARHRRAPPTRRLSRHRRTTRVILAGRAPATARPPIRLNRGRIPALQPA